MADLCAGCKAFRDIVYTEEGTERPFCRECALALPPSSDELAVLMLQLTIPFKVGDRVVAKQAISIEEFRTEGVGFVEQIDTDFVNGGTPVYPTFKVKIIEPAYDGAPAEGWYCEQQLEAA